MVNGDNLHKLHMAAFCLFLKRNFLKNRRGSIKCPNNNSKIQKLNRRRNKGCMIYLLVSKQHLQSGTQGGFTLKTHQTFSVDSNAERIEKCNNQRSFGFVFEENVAGKSQNYRDVIVVVKLRSRENEEPAVSNSSRISATKRLGLPSTVAIKLRVVWMAPQFSVS